MLVKKSNNQVLVKKAVRAVYPVSGGGPVMMLGSGGGGGPRGRTLRERAGGTLGGLIGVAGALTGSHRSLGGLANAMVSGGATGSQLGSALGRKFVGRRGQAMANIREAERAEDARLAAEHKLEFGASGFRNKPIADQRRAYLRGVAERQAAEKQRQREASAASTAYARTFGSERGEEDRNYADMMRQFVSGTGMDPARAGEFMTQFGERINVMQEQQAPSQGQNVAVADPVQLATNAAQANPIQAASNFNSIPLAADGAGAETQRDGALENTANYGAKAINDEIDVEEGTSTPQGDASELTPAQKKVLVRSLRRGEEGQE